MILTGCFTNTKDFLSLFHYFRYSSWNSTRYLQLSLNPRTWRIMEKILFSFRSCIDSVPVTHYPNDVSRTVESIFSKSLFLPSKFGYPFHLSFSWFSCKHHFLTSKAVFSWECMLFAIFLPICFKSVKNWGRTYVKPSSECLKDA